MILLGIVGKDITLKTQQVVIHFDSKHNREQVLAHQELHIMMV